MLLICASPDWFECMGTWAEEKSVQPSQTNLPCNTRHKGIPLLFFLKKSSFCFSHLCTKLCTQSLKINSDGKVIIRLLHICFGLECQSTFLKKVPGPLKMYMQQLNGGQERGGGGGAELRIYFLALLRQSAGNCCMLTTTALLSFLTR